MRPAPLFAAFAALTVLTSACATRPSVPAERVMGEPFALERDLAGQTVGRGVFRTITGQNRAFTAYLNGVWDGETLTLEEDFVFEDGETDRKTWRLTRLPNGEWTGTREDVVGEARGFQDGDAFRLEYLIDQPTDDGGTIRLRFRDVLVRAAEGDIINRATVGYRGFRVGSVDLTITRSEAAE